MFKFARALLIAQNLTGSGNKPSNGEPKKNLLLHHSKIVLL